MTRKTSRHHVLDGMRSLAAGMGSLFCMPRQRARPRVAVDDGTMVANAWKKTGDDLYRALGKKPPR